MARLAYCYFMDTNYALRALAVRLRRDEHNCRVLASAPGCDPETSRRCYRLADYADGVAERLEAIISAATAAAPCPSCGGLACEGGPDAHRPRRTMGR